MSALLDGGDLFDQPAGDDEEPRTELVTTRTPFMPGISTTLSNAEYHSIEAISSTGIKEILRSPFHYRYRMDHPEDSQTDAKKQGTCLHLGILEPELFETGIAIIPPGAPNRPSAKSYMAKKNTPAVADAMLYWAEFDKAAEGKIIVTAKMHDRVSKMVASVKRHPIYAEMVDGQCELSFQWLDGHYGVPCRCRWDFLRNDGWAFDLKSTVDASPEEFAKTVASYRYHLQAAFYNTGHEHLMDRSLANWVFIAVENLAPYQVGLYRLQPNAIQFANNRVEEALRLYKDALARNYWRSYSPAIEPVVLARWAITVPTPSFEG